ncbi:unnamed protein product [Zymoseptoria tritici ST99CH_1E4]|uniref:Uncharacterized protein n=1 Tax=Zymoseptoria tritici ST99CH_1E4 TaxID=1276532 RepID=A0A2H1GQ92_ZYMTR|nr:unnamed protein product [Zymoseptoria tritici ST99CH_1E4]
MTSPSQPSSGVPFLPNEILLQIINEATPSFLKFFVRCGPRSDVPYQAPQLPLQVRHSDSSDWELVRRLKSLSPSIAALTGTHSNFPIGQIPLMVCFDTYDDVSEGPVGPETPNPAVLSWFKRMIIRIPIAMCPPWGPPILGNVSLAFALVNGQWKPCPEETAWEPLPGQTSAKVQNPPGMGHALIQNISSKIPEEFLKEKVSSEWLKRLWWMVRWGSVSTRRSNALPGHSAWEPPMTWRISALEESAALVADREFRLAHGMWAV